MADRDIDEENDINEHWFLNHFHGCCAHCGIKFYIEMKQCKLSTNFTAQRLDNTLCHLGAILCEPSSDLSWGPPLGTFCAIYVDTGHRPPKIRLCTSARLALPTPPLENPLFLHFVTILPPRRCLI